MEYNVGRRYLYCRTWWNRMLVVETVMSRPCVMLWFLCRFRPIHVSARMSCNGSYAGIGRSTYPPVCHAMLLMRVSPDPPFPPCVMCGFHPIHVSPRVACNGSYAGFARSTYPLVCHAMVLMRVSPDPPFPPCVMQCFLYALRPIHVTPRVSCNRTYAGVARSFPS